MAKQCLTNCDCNQRWGVPQHERQSVSNKFLARIITQTIEQMGSNAHNQLQEKCSKFVLLALDKSDDIKDTTQLLIFIHMEYATTFGVS